MVKVQLDSEQLAIVNCDSNNIIVDAAAGAGKTRTLTEKVRKVLSEGADPKSVVVITFTNRAANELKTRLSDIKKSSDCFIGTIHSYANHLLQKTGMRYEIFSEYYQTLFMEQLVPKYGHYCTLDDYKEFLMYDKLVSAGRMSKTEVCGKFSDPRVYNEILYLLGREHSSYYPETVATVCKKNGIITFDELLELTTQYFEKARTKLEYLFVDELQDIGYIEYNFLMKLSATHNFFIGDDYQAIFGFKGGDVNIFLSLMKNPNWKAFYLTTNYRTCKSVLLYANALIKTADNIINKEVQFGNKNQGSLEFLSKSGLDSFVKSIKPGEDWFILTRSNKEMCMVEAVLKKQGVKNYCFKQSNVSDEKLNAMLSEKCVKLMTIHSAKGLECDNVALYGKFPIKKTADSEEVKVFYVGLTRTRNRCVVFI